MALENVALVVFVVCMVTGVTIFGVVYWMKMRQLSEVHDSNVAYANRNFAVIAENETLQKNELNAIRSDISKLDGGLTTSGSRMSLMNEILGKVNSELNSVSGVTGTQGSSLDSLTGRVVGLERNAVVVASELEDLHSQIGASLKDYGANAFILGNRMAGAESNIGGLTVRMGAAEAKLSEYGGLFNSYSNNITTLATSVTAVQNNAIRDAGVIKSLSDSMGTMAGQISGVDGNLTKLSQTVAGLDKVYASVSEVGLLNNNITQLVGQVGAASSRVSALSNDYYTAKPLYDSQFRSLFAQLGTNNANVTTSNLTVLQTANMNGVVNIAGNLSTSNMVRIDREASERYPSGWGKGLHVNNIYANKTIGLGTGGGVKTFLDENGNGTFGGTLKTENNFCIQGTCLTERQLAKIKTYARA